MAINSYNTNIRDYGEDLGIKIEEHKDNTLIAVAKNEGGYNYTAMDVKDLIEWVIKFKPKFFQRILEKASITKDKETNNIPTLNEAIQWNATYQPSIFIKTILAEIERD